MNRLNPYNQVLRRAEIIGAEKRKAGKVAKKETKATGVNTSASTKFLDILHSA
jgi:large subunit ribosomal protein L4e